MGAGQGPCRVDTSVRNSTSHSVLEEFYLKCLCLRIKGCVGNLKATPESTVLRPGSAQPGGGGGPTDGADHPACVTTLHAGPGTEFRGSHRPFSLRIARMSRANWASGDPGLLWGPRQSRRWLSVGAPDSAHIRSQLLGEAVLLEIVINSHCQKFRGF